MQIIADINKCFNIKSYLKIEEILKNKVKMIYDNLDFKIEKILLSIGLDKSIITSFKDNTIKEKVDSIYSDTINLSLKLYTLKDYYCTSALKLDYLKAEVPFCIIISKNIDLNRKNVFMYYENYFSKYALYNIKLFSKAICESSGNSISFYECKDTIKIYINKFFQLDNYKKEENKYIENVIILSNLKYITFFLLLFLDILVLVEGKYEKKLQYLVDLFLESGKDIYVVPSNIYNKNSYFSNYLIKQGAYVILSTNDLKIILKGYSR